MEQEVERVRKGISLFDLFIYCLNRSRLIISITLGVGIFTVITTFGMPKMYQSTARIVASRTESAMSSLISRLGGGGGGFDLMPSGLNASGTDFYVAAFKSPTMADAIIDRFKLMEVYKAKRRDAARKRLVLAIKLESDKKSGIVSISYKDRDPQRAAAITNALIEELEKRFNQIAVSSASRRRVFLEDQLRQSHMGLADAEAELSNFQEDTGAIKFDDQARAVLAEIARLQARVTTKEIELKVMKTYATPYNRDVRKIEEELSGLQEQLQKLETKDGKNLSGILSTGQMPTLGTAYVRKVREFKYRESLHEILTKQYEAARIAEAQEATLINVLDAATVPEMPIGPSRRSIVFHATVSAFFFSIFWVCAREFVRIKLSDPWYGERIQIIKDNLPGRGFFAWLGRLRFRRRPKGRCKTI